MRLLDSRAEVPQRGSDGAAGYDLVACGEVTIGPGQTGLVATGVAIEVPVGYYARIAARSSMALREWRLELKW